MVTRNSILFFPLILIVLLIMPIASIPLTFAQSITYSVNQEWVHVWINSDGSIDLQYNITLTYLSGAPQGIITLGLPKGGYQIVSAKDLSGSSLSYSDVSQGSFYGIDITLKKPIVLNSPNYAIVYATVPGMVSPDSTNPGNVGMSFYPTTFSSASSSIKDVRVLIVLPDGVTMNNVTAGLIKYPTGVPFNNVLMEGSNVAVYWERSNWIASQQFMVGVSFPAKYVNLPGPNILLYVAIILLIVFIVAIFIIIIRRIRKAVYEKPKVSIEALGAARGLTAVEAAVILGIKPVKVLTMIIFSLLLRRFATVKDIGPPIRLELMDTAKNTGVSSPPIRYYEIDFLRAVQGDGLLDEKLLARTYLSLSDNVDRKLRGYSRADTVNYYKSVVEDGWKQVIRAGTPELKGDVIEQNIEWLLADEHYDQRFKQAFPPDIILLPRPGWYWYWPWSGPYIPGRGVPTPTGSVSSPAEVKPIPAQEWANNVVRGMESMSNNIVKDVQSFSNRLIGASAGQSQRPVRSGSNCVCACAHCACACACVGCACACAGGGAR
ncbi:MAG: hypothetical protein QG670_1490 [Thermoproteota archaeon]|nr:hypothetical protein [Thermoproteota archaeon]